MTLANILTTIRILLVPVFIYSLFKYPLESSFPRIIFTICILTDAFDGFIARFSKTKTKLGATLDPIADKLLILSSYLVLTVINKLPVWLFTIALGRDIIIVSGYFVIYIFTGSTKVKARISGKLLVILQTLSVIFILFQLPHMKTIFYMTAVVAVISIMDYCIKGLREIADFRHKQ